MTEPLKPPLNPEKNKARERLFRYLDDALSLSHRKMMAKGNSDAQKQGWARILNASVGKYGELLKDVELDEIQERLEKLERTR